MAVGEQEKKMGESKGFAALSSLVSDVDVSLPAPVEHEAPGSVETAGVRPSAHIGQQAAQPESDQKVSQPSTDSSPITWLAGFAVLVVLVLLIAQGGKQTPSQPAAYEPTSQLAVPDKSVAPVVPQAPPRPVESMPPVGQGLALSTPQIRYCLAEDIRVEGARAAVNNYSNVDVDQFNAMVTDYNIRCANYRYKRGSLESARRDIEQYRAELLAEGKGRFARPSSTASPSVYAQTSPEPISYANRDGTRSDSDFEALSFDEKDAIETACILKRSEGAASYNRCVTAQLAALANGPRKPDLSGLSFDEKDAIETACILKRSEGAASYNRCVTAQLAALANGPRKPDLSGLSFDEKDAIETACILKRSEGAASYNRCVASQLRTLRK